MPEAMNKEATNQPIEFDAIQIGLASPEKRSESGQRRSKEA